MDWDGRMVTWYGVEVFVSFVGVCVCVYFLGGGLGGLTSFCCCCFCLC